MHVKPRGCERRLRVGSGHSNQTGTTWSQWRCKLLTIKLNAGVRRRSKPGSDVLESVTCGASQSAIQAHQGTNWSRPACPGRNRGLKANHVNDRSVERLVGHSGVHANHAFEYVRL